MEEKFNRYVEEWSTEKAPFFVVDKPISREGIEMNMTPRLKEIIEKFGEIRLAVLFEDYKGYEKEAVGADLDVVAEYGKYVRKLALIAPTESLIFQYKIKSPLIKGEVKYFNADEREDAIKWVNE